MMVVEEIVCRENKSPLRRGLLLPSSAQGLVGLHVVQQLFQLALRQAQFGRVVPRIAVEYFEVAGGAAVPSPQKFPEKALCDVPEPSERRCHTCGTPLESSMLLNPPRARPAVTGKLT